MKKIVLLFVAFIALFACQAQVQVPADSASADGKLIYRGARISPEGAKPLSEVMKMLKTQKEIADVKLEAPILDVCQKKGCWMNLKNGEEKIMVKFKDYAFFMPKDCPGKTAVVQGKVFVEETSVEMLRHLAEDGGMSAKDAKKKYKKPQKQLRIEAVGVVIKA
jgi:hypothetical protein